MNNEKQKLSNLIDEYSSEDTDQQSLDGLLGDVNQQYCIKRYQMIGQVMRHELADQIDSEFSESVMRKIRVIKTGDKTMVSQQAVNKNSTKSIWHWGFLKPIAGMVVAASVAIVSITLWQPVSVTSGSSVSGESIVSAEQKKIDLLVKQPIQAAVPASAMLGNASTNSNGNSGMHWKVISDAPALERKLNAYLINHTEYSKSIQGFIPQARVAGYGSEK
jgi:negative regulator of sigma E activity